MDEGVVVLGTVLCAVFSEDNEDEDESEPAGSAISELRLHNNRVSAQGAGVLCHVVHQLSTLDVSGERSPSSCGQASQP